jgi:hypothetical protein
MGQSDIYEFLKQNRRKRFSAKTIAAGMDISTKRVTISLLAMRTRPDKHLQFEPKEKYHGRNYLYWWA